MQLQCSTCSHEDHAVMLSTTPSKLAAMVFTWMDGSDGLACGGRLRTDMR